MKNSHLTTHLKVGTISSHKLERFSTYMITVKTRISSDVTVVDPIDDLTRDGR